LEFVGLLIEQVPTARLLTLLAFRPEFTPPWISRSHITHLTLHRLPRKQVEEMVGHIVAQTLRPSTSSGRTESESSRETLPVRAEPVEARTALPSEIVQQIVAKTDGVPLFVEELTKMVMESSVGATHASPVLLMARLDRLGPAKEIAQLGATLGREFSYELLHAISPLDEAALQQGLRQLVEAELLYQRGLPPQTTYFFKHALIQDAAYQSLLKSTRQQYHQQIALVLEEKFSETKENQPELLAHHYAEAGLIAQAIPYWQQAGQKAVQRSVNVEAVRHLTTALKLLAPLPETPARAQQELDLQLALGPASMATKGIAAPEVEQTYARARALCAQVGDMPQLFPTLWGLWRFYRGRGALLTARELGEQLMRLAERAADPTHRLEAHDVLGQTLFYLGDYTAARIHFEQGIALTDLAAQWTLVLRRGLVPGVQCLGMAANALWCLGYPAQTVRRSQEALALAQELVHP
jgi:predicted ATPase